ncbi:unnamed protein product [Symbiodinium natans]|uniref:Uncharacterized protein n=1 Tax=Symbiodinium natans TaxID=878477 RepID=A0A812QVH1_9DINO|nr:unnamed protein product [Symbiodinium natans]
MVDILKPLADAQAEEAAVDLEEWVAEARRQVEEPVDASAPSEPTSEAAIAEATETIAAHSLKPAPCAEETTTFEARAEASILEADAEAKADGSEEIASTSEMGEEPDPMAPEAKAQDLWTLPAEVEELYADALGTDLAVDEGKPLAADAMAAEEAAEASGWFAMPQGHSAEEAAEEQEPTASDEAAEDPSMPTAEDVLEQFADAIAEEEAAELDELQAAEETAEKPTAPEEVAQDPSTPAAEDEELCVEAPSTNPSVEEMVDILKPLADAQAEEAAADLEEWVTEARRQVEEPGADSATSEAAIAEAADRIAVHALKPEPCAEETTVEASILDSDVEAKADGSEEIASTSEIGEGPEPMAPEAKAQDLWMAFENDAEPLAADAMAAEEAAEVDAWFAMPQGQAVEGTAEEQEPTAPEEAAEDPSVLTDEDVLNPHAEAMAEEEAELGEPFAEPTAEEPEAIALEAEVACEGRSLQPDLTTEEPTTEAKAGRLADDLNADLAVEAAAPKEMRKADARRLEALQEMDEEDDKATDSPKAKPAAEESRLRRALLCLLAVTVVLPELAWRLGPLPDAFA